MSIEHEESQNGVPWRRMGLTFLACAAVIFVIGAFFFGKAASLAEARGELDDASGDGGPTTQVQQSDGSSTVVTDADTIYGDGFVANPEEQSLIDNFEANEDACRGGSGDDPSTMAACDNRDSALRTLNGRNICLGRNGQPEADYKWHRCAASSLRLVGSNASARAVYVDDAHYSGPYSVLADPGAIMPTYTYLRALDQCRGAYGDRSKCGELPELGKQANRAGYCLGTIDDTSEAAKRWHHCGSRSLRF